ncbi:MAG: histidine phosphatase family protein [Pseudomonadota bacterium]
MKILGLLRHAKSEWDDLAMRDFDRTINERGRRGSEVMRRHIARHGIEWGALVASPAARVVETVEISLPDHTPIYDRRLYLASADTIIETVQEHGGGADAVMVSGHNPGLQDTLLELVSPARENDLFKEACVKFPTATLAVLECRIDHWTELRKHVGEMIEFTRPRDLDPALAPPE